MFYSVLNSHLSIGYAPYVFKGGVNLYLLLIKCSVHVP